MKKTGKIILAVAVLAVAVAGAVLAWVKFSPTAQQGEKTITLSVVYEDGSDEEFVIQTDAEYLMEAVEDTVEVGGEFTEYGFTVYSVNGVQADFNGAYWCIYVNGEYGMYALDAQPVTDGDSYALVYETF